MVYGRYQHIALVNIELASPLSIGNGQREVSAFEEIRRDFNGLPVIPAEAIAGVLGNLYQQTFGQAEAEKLFGFARPSGDAAQSAVEPSAAYIHNSQGKPQRQLCYANADHEAQRKDDLLKHVYLPEPQIKEQSRNSHRGVAAHRGKFNTNSIHTGHRFSFTLSYCSNEEAPEQWQRLLWLLWDPRLRFGKATRAGNGAVKLVQAQPIKQLCLDKKSLDDLRRSAALRQGWAEFDSAPALTARPSLAEAPEHALESTTLHLQANFGLRIAGGKHSLMHSPQQAKPGTEEKARKGRPDSYPMTQQRVRWKKGTGRLRDPEPVVPFSSLKGCLASRTVFHHNCLSGVFSEDFNDRQAMEKALSQNAARLYLFGSAKEKNSGQAGMVFANDAFTVAAEKQNNQPIRAAHDPHVAIDRYLGSARDGKLYQEEYLLRPGFQITLYHPPLPEGGIATAWQRAIDDLQNGQLGIGGGTAIGHGFVSDVSEPAAEQPQNNGAKQ